MSVQLIVYPQSFEGQYNEISSSPTEFLVNGINFANLDSTPTYTSIVVPTLYTYLDTLFNAPATIINSWYRFRNDNSGSPAFPTSVGGDLILDTTATTSGNSISGVYQTISNLVVGNQYTITINQSTATNGTIATKISNGSTIYFSSFDFASSTLITNTFIAQSTESTVMIAYENNIVNTATITDISIQPVIGAIPSGATNVLDNGQVIVDLYEDEDIPLSLSVDDFKNVAEQVQSYSKAFNLPATKRNNKIFDQIFEITRSYDGVIFNPYRRTQCVLKQDGFILFEGYLRMLDVTDKEGEISYNVNLYSEVLALADILQDRTFRDLDFTELEHDYNKDNIKRSWNDSGNSIAYTNPSTSGFRDAYTTLRYPFVNWNNQMPISDGTNGIAGFPQLITLGQAFRPFINIKYIIDRIFEATDFTYESSFFNELDFNKLYMDFNWGGDVEPNINRGQGTGENDNITGITAGLTNTKLPFDIESFSNASELGFDITTSRFTASFDNQVYTINATFKFSYTGYSSGQIGQCGWEKFDSSGIATGSFFMSNQLFASNTGASFGNISTSFYQTVILNTGESLRPSFKKFDAGVTLTQLTTQQLAAFSSNSATVTTGTTSTTSETLLENLRGETEQWKFLKGLITMFNLVSLPDQDNPNNIKIEPYQDVFITPALTTPPLNWTEKIDVSQMKLTPLTELNRKTIFKFVDDDDDTAFNQYKNQVGGHLYGSQKYNATNEFNILDGEDEIVAEPFAATIVKPLSSQFPAFITPAIYAMNDDGTSEGFDNSPRIMYNNGIKSTGVSYFIPAQNGVVGSAAETNFLQFSHLSAIPSSSSAFDFHFGVCQLIQGVGSPTANNLFNLYWLPYYSELYNPNTRTMTIKVNLSPADINTFKFNDTVFIKNRVFRVNKIDYKPNDLATVEFILIP